MLQQRRWRHSRKHKQTVIETTKQKDPRRIWRTIKSGVPTEPKPQPRHSVSTITSSTPGGNIQKHLVVPFWCTCQSPTIEHLSCI